MPELMVICRSPCVAVQRAPTDDPAKHAGRFANRLEDAMITFGDF